MNANLLRTATLLFSVLFVLLMVMAAYGSYITLKAEAREQANTCIKINNNNTEMPWESMARQLVGAVSFQ